MRLTPELQLRIDCGVFRVLRNETSVSKTARKEKESQDLAVFVMDDISFLEPWDPNGSH